MKSTQATLVLLLLGLSTAGAQGVTVLLEGQFTQRMYPETVGSITVTLSIDNSTAADTSVQVETVDIDTYTTAGIDYAPISQVLIFPPNSTMMINMTLTIFDDAIFEDMESFAIEASVNGTVVSRAVVLLTDDERLVAGFVQPGYTYSESDVPPSPLVCVSLFNQTLEKTVQFFIGDNQGTAIRNEDYLPVTMFSSFQPLQISPFCFDISAYILDDSVVEDVESFTLTFITVTGDSDLFVVYISDNDGATFELVNTVNPGFGAMFFSITESNVNSTLPVCIQLVSGGESGVNRTTNGLEREAIVLVTTMDGAAGVCDFLSVSNQTVTFPVGSTNSLTICEDIIIFGDIFPEESEFFMFSVTVSNNLDAFDGPTTATVIIQNDDDTPDCGPPPSPGVNGLVNYNTSLLGDTALYFCNNGYQLSPLGVNSRICLISGNWSGVDLSCQIVDCGSLGAPYSGQVLVNGTTFGSIAVYSCFHGYQLYGNTSRTCQSDGMWTGNEPNCTAVDCGVLPDPVNGLIDMNMTTFNNTVSYNCDIGYELDGNETRTCQVNGNWSGNQPSCNVVDCGPLVAPDNGQVTVTTTTYLSEANYSCDGGYTNSSDLQRLCEGDGVWGGVTPNCTDIDECLTSSCDVNAYCTNSLGTFNCSCREGFYGNGLVCQDINECESNTTVTGCSYMCENTIGSFQCTCLTGFVLGNDSKRCDNIDECMGGSNGCHANAQCMDTVGSYTCSCNEGFSGDGVTNCTVVDCGSLGAPSSGQVLVNGTTFRSIAVYSCFHGYQLYGNTSRTCQSDGMWTGNKPNCTVVDCGALTPLPNGSITYSNATIFGSEASYNCNHGYSFVGRTPRVCLASGEWNGEQPFCQVIDCGPLPNISKGTVELNGTLFQSRAVYSCNNGYVSFGSSDSVRTCLENGQWSGVAVLCVRDGSSDPNTAVVTTIDIVVLSLSVSVGGFSLAVVITAAILLISVRRARRRATDRVYSVDTTITNQEPALSERSTFDTSLSSNTGTRQSETTEFPLSENSRPIYATLHHNS